MPSFDEDGSSSKDPGGTGSTGPFAIADVTGLQAELDNKISGSTINAKGDLLLGTANDTVGRLAVGTNGQVLTADSAESTGAKWVNPSATDSTKVAKAGDTMTGTLISLAQQYNTASSPGASIRARHTDGAGLGLYDNVASGGSHYRTIAGAIAEQLSSSGLLINGLISGKPAAVSCASATWTTVGSVAGYAQCSIEVQLQGSGSRKFDWDGTTLTAGAGSTTFEVTGGGSYVVGVRISSGNVQLYPGSGIGTKNGAMTSIRGI